MTGGLYICVYLPPVQTLVVSIEADMESTVYGLALA